MPEFLLGLDVGTTSARALVFDPAGKVTGAAQIPLTNANPFPGLVEQDATSLWECVRSTIARALDTAGLRPDDLASIGVTTQRSSIVIWERADIEPVAPVVVWSDLRGVGRAAELKSDGHPVMAVAAAAKLEAVVDAVPDGRSRAERGDLAWGTVDSYLVSRLSGGALHVTDYSSAWSSGYLDFLRPTGWNSPLIEHQGLPVDFFPDLCDTTGRLGATTAGAIGAEVPIGAIVADQQAGMFAHGATRPGDWKATYGTSGVLMTATGDTPDFTSGLVPMVQAGWSDRTLFAVEGMVNSAGGLVDWMVGLGLAGSPAALTALAAAVPDPGGVTVRPALQGLGAPHNDATARAEIRGLSGATTPAHLARAVLESIAYRIREIADFTAARPEGCVPPESLPVDGGLARSDVFLQIQADILGRPVERHHQVEATALGAAMAGALGVGAATAADLAACTCYGRVFELTVDPAEAAEGLSHWQDTALGTHPE